MAKRKGKYWNNSRKIGKKRFAFDSTTDSAFTANHRKKELKNKGYNVSVVRTKNSLGNFDRRVNITKSQEGSFGIYKKK